MVTAAKSNEGYLAHNVTGTHELQVPRIRYGYLETLLSLSLSLSFSLSSSLPRLTKERIWRVRGYKFRVLSRGIILK